MLKLLSSFNAINLCYLAIDGYNQEDSIIFNKSYIDRGGMSTLLFKIMEIKIETNENLCDPREVYSNDSSSLYEYRNIGSNGLINKNAIVKEGDPVAFIAHRIKGGDSIEPQYKPVKFYYKEKARVIGIHIISGVSSHDNNKIIKIHLEVSKSLSIGDKGSTNNGCKFTTAKIIDEVYLPVLANGMRPTAIKNPSTIPTRMVNNQQMQQGLSRMAYAFNMPIDCSGFNGVNPQQCIDALNKLSPMNYNYITPMSKLIGENGLVSSFTSDDYMNEHHHFFFTGGNMTRRGENQIFNHVNGSSFTKKGNLGQTVVIVINKFASESVININDVPRLRLGEMEMVIGFATFLNGIIEKSTYYSDGRDVFVCSKCGSLASVFNYSPLMKKIIGKCSNPSCYNTVAFYRYQSRGEVIKFQNVSRQLGIEFRQPTERSVQTVII